jgi:Arc/MetJ-type ribon-helix-helix transcriptional regulator
MPIESRTRMVSFRLTSEEYERFRQLCFARGLRNVSELVRAAVNHMLTEPALPHPTAHSVESRLSHLEERLQSLALLVEALNQSGDPAAQPQPIRQAAAR